MNTTPIESLVLMFLGLTLAHIIFAGYLALQMGEFIRERVQKL